MPKVNVVLLTYNRANYLKLQIESILNQTFEDFQLTILDNNSQDNTSEIVNTFNDDRIEYVRHPKNIGGLGNIKFALNYANNKYLILLHDDDTIEPDLLKRQVEILDNNHDVVVVGTNFSRIDKSGNKFSDKFIDRNEDFIFKRYEYIEYYFKSGNLIACPSVMFRVEFIKLEKLWFKSEIGPVCDLYFWFEINLIKDKYIYIINEPLLNYRIHDKQDSQQNHMAESEVKFLNAALKLFKNNGLENFIRFVKEKATYVMINSFMNKVGDSNSANLLHDFEQLIINSELFEMDVLSYYRIKLYLRFNNIVCSEFLSKLEKKFENCHISESDIAYTYRKWNDKTPITNILKSLGINQIAILGTKFNGYLVLKDANLSGISVKCFLDNNKSIEREYFEDIKIESPEYLRNNFIEAVIISVENSYHEQAIRKQIAEISKDTKVFSWRELIEISVCQG